MPHFFTLEEANRALPDVEQAVRQLRRLRDEALELRRHLEELWRASEGESASLSAISQAQEQMDALQEEFGTIVADLEARGVVLRDLDMGLVDFPSVAGNAEVYLCWQLGEAAIGFWHGLGEGYAARKPLAKLPGHGVH